MDNIEILYGLLEQAEKEKDCAAVSTLGVVIPRLEKKRIDKLYELLERAEKEKDYDAVSTLHWVIFTLENQ